jgi:hypothetical protein
MPRRSAAAQDLVHTHTLLTHKAQAGVADVPLGETGDEIHRHAEIGQRNGHFASPPPYTRSNDRACPKRKKPGGESRIMISPNVTTLGDIALPPCR